MPLCFKSSNNNSVLAEIFTTETILASLIELPCKTFKDICIYCGKENGLVTNREKYSKRDYCCNKELEKYYEKEKNYEKWFRKAKGKIKILSSILFKKQIFHIYLQSKTKKVEVHFTMLIMCFQSVLNE